MAEKYTRKEFLKYAGKVGLGVAIGGTIGNVLGRGYREVRDLYREEIAPTVEKVEDFTDRVGDFKDNVKEKSNKFLDKLKSGIEKVSGKKYEKSTDEEKKEEKKEEETMTRRSFFQKYLHTFNEHPVGVGTATGSFFGGLRNLVKKYTNYSKEKQANESTREIKRLGEKISDLEKTLKKDSDSDILSIGMVGFFLSVVMGISSFTGNVINHSQPLTRSPIIAAITFVVSLGFIFFAIRKR